METYVYHIIHVAAGFLLTGVTFQAFAAPHPERKRGVMLKGGILSLIMLVAGFALLGKLKLGFPIWVIVKLVCWLVLSAIAGVAFRRPRMTPILSLITSVVIVVALYMVYAKPQF